MSDSSSTHAPTAQSERFQILDVLRGFALLGVLIANLVELGGQDVLATADQLAALPSANVDTRTNWLLNLLVFDKFNTLFAVLFGAGFWIMMERLSKRGAAFEQIYLRRITLLTAFGFVHLFGWFAWDILHLYGLMAFILFYSRRLPDRALFWIGFALLAFARPLIEGLKAQSGALSAISDTAFTDAAILERQTAAVSGNFFEWVGAMNSMTWIDWFLSGTVIAWLTYTLGRFYIGAWIARQGWVETAESRLDWMRKWTLPILVVGFGLEALSLSLQDAPRASWAAAAALLPDVLQGVATPMIAAGYVCVLSLIFFSPRLSWLVQPFAPVGQMALTNYLLQSPFIIFILTGIGPGLGLVGRAGSTDYMLFALGFILFQMIFSAFWMRAFQYGLAEWVWRAATYRTWPKMRRSA